MQSILWVTLTGTFACAAGTGFGAFIATFFKKSSSLVISVIMGMAGGLMLAVVTFDLLPQAIILDGLDKTLLGILVGVIFVIAADKIISGLDFLKKYGKGIKSGVLLIIGLAAHNFPEGLAVGSGFAESASLGLELVLVIAMHDVPEGAAVAAPLLGTGLKRWKIVFLAVLTALPTAIGAYVGVRVGNISKDFITLCLGFAGGTMLYIICEELIPGSKSLSKGIASTMAILAGIILGLIVCSRV